MCIDQINLSIGRFHERFSRERRRQKNHRGIRSGLVCRPRTVLKIGQPPHAWFHSPGVTPPTICVPYAWLAKRMKRLAPSKSLYHHSRIFINQDRYMKSTVIVILTDPDSSVASVSSVPLW